jgi:histone acetyltransferase (RNA polymerase elongator complex component)
MAQGPPSPPRPFIVPLFLPQAGCPHQCAFCNQRSISGTPQGVPEPAALERQIERFLGYRDRRRGETQIAFYGGNFLGLGRALVEELLTLAQGYVAAGRAAGIRFSTRPDSVDARRLAWLAPFTVTTIELGVQSMNDRVLTLAGRGHSAGDSAAAMVRLKAAGYRIGAQLMVGLPGDSRARSLASGEAIARLGPDFVRIYPTLVLRGSRLALTYRRGRYAPWSLARAVATVKDLYLLFQAHGIPVIRMGLQAAAELEDGRAVLAGPYHPAFGHLVLSEIFLDRASACLARAFAAGEAVRLRVHPRSAARLRGHKNRNLQTLRRRFGLGGIQVLSDDRLGLAEVIAERLETPWG